MLSSVNKLARAVAKWTRACDKRLACLISDIHHTSDHRQYCHVGNTAQHCRLGLFQDSDFAGDLDDSKSTSGEKEGEGGEGRILCIFGSHTFVLISWMCKKQTSVSRSSTESEVISLDAGLRMDGIPFSQDTQHWNCSMRLKGRWQKKESDLRNSKIESSSCRCTVKKHVCQMQCTQISEGALVIPRTRNGIKTVWNAHLQARRFAEQISRDHNADPGESGHPVFRATSALDRGSLKSKKG